MGDSRHGLERLRLVGAIVCSFVLPTALASETTLIWDSEGSGDWVGQGGSGTVTDGDGVWVPGNEDGKFRDAKPRLDDEGEFSGLWNLHFGAAEGEELVPGVYPDATGSTSLPDPFIDISYDGRGCGSGASGNFTVSAIQHDVYGNPIRFVAQFLQRCQDNDPALTGTIDHTFDGTLGPATFTEGNVLLMYRNQHVFGVGNLFELTPAGTELQVLPLARPAGGPPAPFRLDRFGDRVKDVVMDASGRVHVFIGDEDAWLGSFDPVTGIWQYVEYPDWNVFSLFDNVGALAAFGNYIFATDDSISGDVSGIMRFDADNPLVAQRFADGKQYDDLAAGYDGRLYALEENDSDSVDVYDPETMTLLGNVALAVGVSGIAVNAAGEIFATTYGSEFQGTLGTIYHFDQSGATLNSLTTNVKGTFDIDLTRSGDILIGRSASSGDGARIIVTDASLASFAEINPDPDTTTYPHTFVGWVQPPPSPAFSADGFESGDTSGWSRAVGGAAGHLDLNSGAAFAGSFGLEVTVGGTCSAQDDEVITSPAQLEGTFTACNSVTASGVEVSGAGATFQAGNFIALGQDFSVAASTPFTTTLDSGLQSGLAYVGDDSPDSAGSYNGRFRLRLDDLTITDDTESVQIFNGYSGSNTPQFRAIAKRNIALAENRLILEARKDDGTFAKTPIGEEILLAPGWHELRFAWSSGEGDGFFFVTVDGGVPQGGLGGFDNGDQVIDSVRLGYVGGNPGTTSGNLDVDDFSSWL
jgi:hypothetical protein